MSVYHTILCFNNLKKRTLENIMGKGENAGNQYSPFPTIFSALPETSFKVLATLSCHLQMLSLRTSLKFCRLLKC